MGDLVDLSPEARQKIERGRKVSNYLSMFGAFLKLLNSPLSRSYVPDLENPARNKVQKTPDLLLIRFAILYVFQILFPPQDKKIGRDNDGRAGINIRAGYFFPDDKTYD